MKIQHLILAIAIFIIPCPLFSGPFGLEMGMQPNDPVLKNLEEKRPGVYFTKLVPKPHTAFEEYYLYFDPNYGLVKIKAFSPPIPSVKVQQKLSQLYDELTPIYGECSNHKEPGSETLLAHVNLPPKFSQDEPQFVNSDTYISHSQSPGWIDKLFERLGIFLPEFAFDKASWLKDQGEPGVHVRPKFNEKNNIVSITLERAAFNQDSDVIVLEYHFSNYSNFPPDGLDKLPENNGSVL
jgi:hypothetical protein